MTTEREITDVLADIQFKMFPAWKLELRYDADRPYLQVACEGGTDNDTGLAADWRGRKWMLSPHMTVTEIVCTAFKAYEAAIYHEFRELFTYRGERIFDPHRSVELLVEIANRPDAVDARRDPVLGKIEEALKKHGATKAEASLAAGVLTVESTWNIAGESYTDRVRRTGMLPGPLSEAFVPTMLRTILAVRDRAVKMAEQRQKV